MKNSIHFAQSVWVRVSAHLFVRVARIREKTIMRTFFSSFHFVSFRYIIIIFHDSSSYGSARLF